MTGSHIDTVRTGGRFDGNLGVLAGLEVIETLEQRGVDTGAPDRGRLLHRRGGRPLRARHARQPRLRRRAAARGGARRARPSTAPASATSWTRIGYAGPLPCPGPAPARLRRAAHRAGPGARGRGHHDRRGHRRAGHLVEELTITGQSNHAGTTPMRLRHDAGYVAAARSPTFVRDLAAETRRPPGRHRRPLELHPDLVNVVAGAGHAHRRPAQHRRAPRCSEAERRLADVRRRAGRRRGRRPSTPRSLARFEPVEFDAERDRPRRGARPSGSATRRGACRRGAGHDAQMLARVCPTAMIFVPSVGGISHNLAEHTDPADLEAGANVLLARAAATWPTDADGRRRRREPHRARRRRAARAGRSATTPARTSSSACSPCCTRPPTARLRARRVPRAGAHDLLPPLVRRRPAPSSTPSTRREMPGPDTQPLFDEAAAPRRRLLPRLRRARPPRRRTATTPRSSSSATGAIVARYRKVHLPGHEDHEPWPPVPAPRAPLLRARPGRASACGGRSAAVVGMMICNDRRWPETYRVMGLQGVELILCGYNTPIHYAPDPSQDILPGLPQRTS